MIITIQNTTRQARVYQLDQRVASGSFKGRSETVVRIDHDTRGNSEVRRKRLRHGPVLRLLAGEVKEVPAAILHDSKLNRDTKGRRPPIKILRRETPEEHAKRLDDEAKAAKDLAERRKAAAKRQADHVKKSTGAETAPQPQPEPDEKAGSEGDQGSSGTRKRGRGKSTD